MEPGEREALLEAVVGEYARAVVLADPNRLDVWEDLGLTMSQLRVLIILSTDAGMTAGALAARLGVRPSTVTGIVDRLVRQDLVLRKADTEDRRVVRNHLTQAGSDVSADISRAGRAFITRILDELGDDDLRRAFDGLSVITGKAEAMALLASRPRAAELAEAP